MLPTIHKIRQLSSQDLGYLAIAFLYLAIFKIAIKTLPIGTLKRYFARIQASTPAQNIAAKALAINRVAHVFSFLGFSCLPKALAFRYWLRHTPQLSVHFGVQRDHAQNFVAHAWVSQQGKILLGHDPSISYQSIWVWQ
jgi:hypothetical protein